MPISQLHTGHNVLFESGSGLISQISSLTYSTNTEILDGFSNGCPERLFAGVMKQMHEFQFTTSQLLTVLTYLDFTGFYTYCPSSVVYVYFREMVNCGVRFDSGFATHINAEMLRPFMVLDSIEVSQDSEASGEVKLLPIFDGIIEPVGWNDFGTLGGACGSTQHYVPGPVFLGGVGLIDGVQRIRIDFNTNLHEHSAKGDPWPCWIGVKDHAPRVTIDVLDMPQVVKTAIAGVSVGGTGGANPRSARFYLRRMENLSNTGFDGRYDDAESEHLQFDTIFALLHIGELSYSGPNEEVITQMVFETVAVSPNTAPLGNLVNQTITAP